MVYYIENETRYYPKRHTNFTSNFFISYFANVGIGLYNNDYDILWQSGLGIGYFFYNCMPLTMQMGVDNNLRPILYVNIMSKLNHLP